MRPSKEQYYLNIAKEIAQRSTCFRQKAGVVLIKDDAIVSTGYIGAPRKTKDCLERGECLRDKLGIPHGQQYECCRSVHAEQNSFLNACRSGSSVLGADMFMWAEDGKGNPLDSFPCYICKKMIMNTGVNRFVGSTQKGSFKIYFVEDWVNEWKEKDILDDKHQYGSERNKQEGYQGYENKK